MSTTLITKVTPIRIVEAIEPLLDLWERRLGFTKVVGVPEGDRLAFALLVSGSTEMMLQTKRSVAADLPAVAALDPETVLYVETSSLDETLRALDGFRLLAGPRTTFYGMREAVIVDSSETVIVFAQPIGEKKP